MTRCPECLSEHIREEDYIEEEFWSTVEFTCNDCGCEWVEEWKVLVATHGDTYEKDEESMRG